MSRRPKFVLQRVRFMPKELSPGVLYVSEEFGTAAHLCPCGCRSKVRTPLGLTEWTFTDSPAGPTLFPSVGNWQLECRSQQIAAGRIREDDRRRAYYDALYRHRGGFLGRVKGWFSSLLMRQ
jgi:Family of unknown function (DUF6527)